MKSTFDNYLNRKSFWHSLNPVAKLIITIIMIVVIFMPIDIIGQVVILLTLSLMCFLGRIPLKTIKSILITWAVMLFILFIINWIAYKAPWLMVDYDKHTNWIFGHGLIDNQILININGHEHYCIFSPVWCGDIDPSLHTTIPSSDSYFNRYVMKVADNGDRIYLWYHIEWYALSAQVISNSLSVSFKILLMIMVITLLVSTTSEVQLTIAIEEILSPLKLFKIPVNEWAMTISIAIRFVPSLLSEAQNILRAQASRGVDFRNGNFKDKIKSLVSLIVPMFSVAFHKADDLSNTMEARNYSPRAIRTNYRNFGVSTKDFIALSIIGIIVGFLIFLSANRMIVGFIGWLELLIIY